MTRTYLELKIRHYSRCAIASHYRQRREWFESQVRETERLLASLDGGAQ